MILENLNFIQRCNFNLTDFLKRRNFCYDLVLLNKRKERKIAGRPQANDSPPQNVASPLLRAEIVISPQGAFFEKLTFLF